MVDLGAFGAAIKELDPNQEKDTFTYFGEKFEIVSALPPILMFQLAASMTGKVDETEGMGALWEAFRLALGDDEFNRFYRVAVEKRDSNEGLMTVAMAIYQNDAGRPTVQPSDSSDGLSSVSPSSSASFTVTDSVPALGLVDRSRMDDLVPVSRILAG
jgi:hypothetical protein